MASQGVDVDRVMRELGQLQRFHVRNYCLLALVTISVAVYGINYVFLAADVPYRCLIPECESSNSSEYSPPWLEGALPPPDHPLERRCMRRAPAPAAPAGACDVDSFSQELQPCTSWVYESHDTIVAEVSG
ncbi:unnamed protein product [Plutella xylostella]|uniref:(diamondback moth) hypothetical protein n=1 Tax=Plutella xylostella TaxID=51655 RepID=A0A8S4GCS4_PLUXY|nr:unnamed protein product [Plutella xylostella]